MKIIHISYGKQYFYKGIYFERTNYCGYLPIKKDGEERKNYPRNFSAIVNEFDELSKEEKKRFLI
jgi:hypothetical protein